MNNRFNIYCDESCHLEHDRITTMVIGALVCPQHRARQVADAIRTLKHARGLTGPYELKWARISPSFLGLYEAALDLFFADDDLRFRAVIIDKTLLRHSEFVEQDHDTFYYKMHYTLLDKLITPPHQHFVYMDIKDTRSAKKMAKLHEVLRNRKHDPACEVVRCVHPVRSEQVEQLQLTDVLIGAIAYANRGLASSAAKVRLVESLRTRSGLSLTSTTSLWAQKVNILKWVPGGQ